MAPSSVGNKRLRDDARFTYDRVVARSSAPGGSLSARVAECLRSLQKKGAPLDAAHEVLQDAADEIVRASIRHDADARCLSGHAFQNPSCRAFVEDCVDVAQCCGPAQHDVYSTALLAYGCVFVRMRVADKSVLNIEAFVVPEFKEHVGTLRATCTSTLAAFFRTAVLELAPGCACVDPAVLCDMDLDDRFMRVCFAMCANVPRWGSGVAAPHLNTFADVHKMFTATFTGTFVRCFKEASDEWEWRCERAAERAGEDVPPKEDVDASEGVTPRGIVKTSVHCMGLDDSHWLEPAWKIRAHTRQTPMTHKEWVEATRILPAHAEDAVYEPPGAHMFSALDKAHFVVLARIDASGKPAGFVGRVTAEDADQLIKTTVGVHDKRFAKTHKVSVLVTKAFSLASVAGGVSVEYEPEEALSVVAYLETNTSFKERTHGYRQPFNMEFALQAEVRKASNHSVKGAYWGTMYPSDVCDTLAIPKTLDDQDGFVLQCHLSALTLSEQKHFVRYVLGFDVLDDSAHDGVSEWSVRASGSDGWRFAADDNGKVRIARAHTCASVGTWVATPKELTLSQALGYLMTHNSFAYTKWERSSGVVFMRLYTLTLEDRHAHASSLRTLAPLAARAALASDPRFAGWATFGVDTLSAYKAQVVADITGPGRAVVMQRGDGDVRMHKGSGGRHWVVRTLEDEKAAWALGWRFAKENTLIVNVLFHNIPTEQEGSFAFSCLAVDSVAKRMRNAAPKWHAEQLRFASHFHPLTCGDPTKGPVFEQFANAVYERKHLSVDECDLYLDDEVARDSFGETWKKTYSVVAFAVPYGNGRTHEVTLRHDGSTTSVLLYVHEC